MQNSCGSSTFVSLCANGSFSARGDAVITKLCSTSCWSHRLFHKLRNVVTRKQFFVCVKPGKLFRSMGFPGCVRMIVVGWAGVHFCVAAFVYFVLRISLLILGLAPQCGTLPPPTRWLGEEVGCLENEVVAVSHHARGVASGGKRGERPAQGQTEARVVL